MLDVDVRNTTDEEMHGDEHLHPQQHSLEVLIAFASFIASPPSHFSFSFFRLITRHFSLTLRI